MAEQNRPANGDAGSSGAQRGAGQVNVASVLGLRLPVAVRLAHRRMKLGQILSWGVGTIIEFDKPVADPLDLMANSQRIGNGQAVVVGENFGLQVSSVGPVQSMIRTLGG